MGPRLLGLVLLGLAAGRVHAQTGHYVPAPALTAREWQETGSEPVPAQSAYANRAEHWAGRWRLVRRGRQVMATLATARSPVPHPAPSVLFRVPPGFRPARLVTQTVAPAWPVDGQGQALSAPAHRFALQVARDGAVRYVDHASMESVDWVRYETTLVWTTDEAECGGGVLHGRTQGVVDALEAQTGLACAAIGPDQLATVTALDLHRDLAGLRVGDFAGLSALQTLDLRYNYSLSSLPAGLFADLSALQTLNLNFTGLESLPAGVFVGLESLRALHLRYTHLTTLPAELFAPLQDLRHLWLGTGAGHGGLYPPVPDIDLTALPAGLFAGLTQLQELHLFSSHLTAVPDGLLADLNSLHTLVWHAEQAPLPTDFLVGRAALQTLELVTGLLPAGLFADLARLHTLRLVNVGWSSTMWAGLEALQTLEWYVQSSGAPPARLFAGLDRLHTLRLVTAWWTSVPAGLFAGLDTLYELEWFAGKPRYTGFPPEWYAYWPNPAQGRMDQWTDGGLALVPAGLFAGLGTLHTLTWYTAELETVPTGLFTGLDSLHVLQWSAGSRSAFDNSLLGDWSGTNGGLVAVPAGLFADLVQLHTLVLAAPKLAELPAGLFAALARLQRLTLHSEALAVLPAGLFIGLVSLRQLRIGPAGPTDMHDVMGDRRNVLTALPAGIFADLSRLESLDLSANQLTDLPAGIFADLPLLESLDLGCNALSSSLLARLAHLVPISSSPASACIQGGG